MKTILLLLALMQASFAATYYIDYDGGNDSNAGTSKGAPWKHVPVMEPFSGSYTHADGDQFIFKGGVTWPNAALPLYIDEGGASGNRDYYGIDETWYAGGAWTRPVFDAEGIAFVNHTANHRENVIRINGSPASYVDIDGFEIKNWETTNPVANHTDQSGVNIYNADFITITNCYIHSWDISAATAGGYGVCRGYNSLGGTQVHVVDCIITGPSYINPTYITSPDTGDPYTSGQGVQAVDLVDNCTISLVSQGVWNPIVVRNCYIYNCGNDYRGAHENAIWIQNTKTFYNNIVDTIYGGVGAFFLPGWGARTPHHLNIYNNVFMNLPQVNLTNKQAPDPNGNSINFFNNIIDDNINVGHGDTGGNDYGGNVVIANNLFITTDTDVVVENDPIANLDERASNVTMTPTEATAAGLLEANFYKPTSAVTELFNQGEDLSGDISGFTFDIDNVTRTGTWDVGAYEYIFQSVPRRPKTRRKAGVIGR